MKKKERVKDPDKIKKRDNIFTIILSICDVVAVVVLFLLYGPFNGFRDWLVTTAMSTMNHQYFATTFYSDEYINKVLARHSIKEPDGNTDISEIIGKEENYIDEYDKEILDRNKKDIYKLIEINEKGFSGYLVAIYDPSKIKVGDVITFNSTDYRSSGVTVTHRVKKVEKTSDGKYLFTTKGDANNTEDATRQPFSSIYGKVLLRLPKLGYIQYILSTVLGWLLLIIIPTVLIIGADIIKIIKTIKDDPNLKDKNKKKAPKILKKTTNLKKERSRYK